MSNFRIFTRVVRPVTQNAFFTSASASTPRTAAGWSQAHAHGLTLIKGLAVAGIGGAIISKFIMSTADAEAPGEAKKIFGRAGPVFTTLALQSAEDVNHNTKKLRFALPNEGDVSGLPLTCEWLRSKPEEVKGNDPS